MKIGFIGLPKSGKTTLFNALTGSSAAVSAYAAGRAASPNLAAVKVGDERVTALSAIYRPKRIVYPTIDIVDLAGVSEGDARSDPVLLFKGTSSTREFRRRRSAPRRCATA
jgi:ribosome-binding ATPase YchF (GTP1/OBG family)